MPLHNLFPLNASRVRPRRVRVAIEGLPRFHYSAGRFSPEPDLQSPPYISAILDMTTIQEHYAITLELSLSSPPELHRPIDTKTYLTFCETVGDLEHYQTPYWLYDIQQLLQDTILRPHERFEPRSSGRESTPLEKALHIRCPYEPYGPWRYIPPLEPFTFSTKASMHLHHDRTTCSPVDLKAFVEALQLQERPPLRWQRVPDHFSVRVL